MRCVFTPLIIYNVGKPRLAGTALQCRRIAGVLHPPPHSDCATFREAAERLDPVSYTHLRAHETLMNL
eukprot:4688244-Prymnesium_polylepis.1